ncbi:MAG: acetyl-CoA carboxylase biotin carboxyl carrier protein subunit [Clostridia bacterium]|nr:acetyl-CoA carboxylase biotin carboxyl carrier protein subunit [Clostridia bacterium]
MKYELKLKGRTYEVEVELAEPMTMQEFQVYAPAPVAPAAPAVEAKPSVASATPSVAGDGECVPSPMPGSILKVHVTAGQTIKEGDCLVVLEAMKMENEITAPKGGTVTQVLVEKGATVETGAPLVFIR